MTREFLKAEAFVSIAEPLLATASVQTRAFGHAVIADLSWYQDLYVKAIPHIELSRDAYREIGMEAEVCRCNSKLGFCLYKTGFPEGGSRLLAEALASARAQHFREVEALGCRFFGVIQMEQGNTEAALGLFREAQALARSLELPHEEFMALWYQLSFFNNAKSGRRSAVALNACSLSCLSQTRMRPRSRNLFFISDPQKTRRRAGHDIYTPVFVMWGCFGARLRGVRFFRGFS